MAQSPEILHLAQRGDLVLSHVELLEVGARGEVAQRPEVVDGERDDLDVGHVAEIGDVVDLAAPQVEVLDGTQRVEARLLEDERLGQGNARRRTAFAEHWRFDFFFFFFCKKETFFFFSELFFQEKKSNKFFSFEIKIL